MIGGSKGRKSGMMGEIAREGIQKWWGDNKGRDSGMVVR